MNVMIKLNPPREEQSKKRVDLVDTEISALLCCDTIEIDGSIYKITGKNFCPDPSGVVLLTISADLQE